MITVTDSYRLHVANFGLRDFVDVFSISNIQQRSLLHSCCLLTVFKLQFSTCRITNTWGSFGESRVETDGFGDDECGEGLDMG